MKAHPQQPPTESSHRPLSTTARAILTAALSLTLLAAFLPTASARTTRPYETSLDLGSGSLAVDQSNGNIFVGRERFTARFTAGGAPQNFTAGPAAGTNALPGSLVAIDNSGGALDGSIYFVEDSPSGDKVGVFAGNGASRGAVGGAGVLGAKFGTEVCGVAIDQSNGALYVTELRGGESHIWRYDPTSSSGSIDDSDYALTGITLGQLTLPCRVAADSGNVYVVQPTETQAGSRSILNKYSASSFTADFSSPTAPTAIDTGELKAGVTGVTVDPKNGDVYVNEGHKVAVFDSTGSPLYSFGAAAYFGNGSEAIAVKSAASGPATKAYVADPQEGSREVDVFGALGKTPTFTHPEVASFGPDGSSGSSFSSNSLNSLAFDQAARRLYAVDAGAPGVFGFDASAPPAFPALSGFAPLGAPANSGRSGLAVDNTALGSAGSLYLASGETGLFYGWAPSGSPLGGAFPVDPATSPGPPNGSPKDLCGAAVDSDGNAWVANYQSKRVLKYSSAGASLPGAVDTSAQGRPCSIAFDSNDDLYIAIVGSGEDSQSGIWKYTAASGYTSVTRISSAPRDENLIQLAVEPSNGHLFAAVHGICNGNNCNITSWVDEYDPAGSLVDEFALSATASYSGVAVDATSHGAYVADTAGRKVLAFGAGVLLPEATARPASGATNTAVTLNGLVNPQGLSLSDCHFDYVTEAAFRVSGFSDLSSGGSVPCTPAAGSIPLDLDEHSVSATAGGLAENTDYRFRLSATNANGTGTAEGAVSSAGRPLVETTGSPVRGATSARLDGRVDAHGEATTYHFEYGTEGPCDANPCEATEAHAAGSGTETELVSQQVEGLQPNTTYHYRLIADNGNPAGLGTGADMSVTTRASDAPLTHGRFPGPPGSNRAYEQVSLPDTGGNPVAWAWAASDDGNRAFYKVNGGTPISNTGTLLSSLFAERIETAPHVGGWRSQDLAPPRDQLAGNAWGEPMGKLDLSDQLMVNFNTVTYAGAVWRLRPGQPADLVFQSDGSVTPMVASDDASRVLVYGAGSLDPAHPLPPGLANLYDVSSGPPKLVGLMPDGSLPPCTAAVVVDGGDAPRASHWLSADGSHLFFQSCTNLYMRDLVAEQTKLIANNSSFIKSIPGAAFFTTNQSLEPGDTGGSDIYRYDIGDEALKCVTCVVPAGLNANVDGGSIAVAADGSRVYFVSPNVLLPGAATPGIYRVDVDSGSLAYVASIDSGSGIGEKAPSGQAFTPDGSALIFASDDPSLNAIGGQQNGGTLQYYRYDDRDRSLACLSCPQDGSAPFGAVPRQLLGPSLGANGANKTALSVDGRTFAFVTPTSLLGADQNTARPGQKPQVGTDVYEWRDGRLFLITDGLVEWPPSSPPEVSAITPSGSDIFFVASYQYTPDALDGYKRLYDARIGGGFEVPPPPKPCPLEVCQGTPKGAPEEQAPGTGTFAGPGNATTAPGRRPCREGRHRARKGNKARCMKGQGKKQSKSQRAKHDRRAQR